MKKKHRGYQNHQNKNKKSENYETRTEQYQKIKNSKITVNHRINTRIKMI